MIRGIHHVAISTPNLDRLAAFYTDVIGFTPVMETAWADRPLVDRMIGGYDRSAARQVMLQAGNAHLELFEYSSPTPTPANPDRTPADHGYTHFCLDVVDIDAEYERLSAHGVTFNSAPPTVQEMGGVARLRAIYGREPDGNIIELQEVLDTSIPFALEQTAMINTLTPKGGTP
jgi:catechol 2,3-dioxygenase-like lactoylglutathione lyase family enzyme